VNPPVVAVAFSGGRDSTALLHATLRAARDGGVQVVALHVHHNLQPEADTWLAHAQQVCQRWSRGAPLRLLHRRLAGTPARGDSVEAWARRERYRALADMAHEAGAELVLLAQHRRDQAETFLLRA
jgi:tRNA(Ile)-lysidine synthase